MKKFGVFLLAVVLVCSIAFPAFADEVIPMQQVTPKEGVTEVYINDTNYQSGDLSITTISNEPSVEIANDNPDLEIAQPLIQAAEIPSDVKEVYLESIEIEDGVYELRDPNGTLVATMYDATEYDATDEEIAAFAAKKKTVYSIDWDIAAGSWTHGNEKISAWPQVTISYDIDFARETPSYLGFYNSENNTVSWFSQRATKGFYGSTDTSANYSPCIAIKNDGTQANIYTGTVTVTS